MEEWPPKLKLLSVLATTKELLLRSEDEGWPDEDPSEVAQEVGALISHVLEPDNSPLPEHALALFAPTGPIQEIAISNDWHSAFMALSEEYDGLESILNAD